MLFATPPPPLLLPPPPHQQNDKKGRKTALTMQMFCGGCWQCTHEETPAFVLVAKKMVKAVLLAAVLAASAAAGQVHAVNYPTTVRTSAGLVDGFVSENSRVWRGIPYAEADRFGPPHAPVPWSGTKETKTQNPICPQAPYVPFAPGLNMTLPHMDEDCMFATVYAPKSGMDQQRFPVMVMMHGDVLGSGSTSIDDKTGLSNTGEIVVVECDFRLDKLANVVLPGMVPEMSNNWFKDQQAFLLWVKENIAAFGGDASRITINGELTPASLMHITEGNEVIQPKNIIVKTPQPIEHYKIADVVAATVTWAAESPRNCNQTTSPAILACLRALPWQSVTATTPTLTDFPIRMTFGPGTTFDMQPMEYMQSGRYNKNVTMMVGNTNGTGHSYAIALPYYLSNFQTVTPFESLQQQLFSGIMFFYWILRVGLPQAAYPLLMQIYGSMAMQPDWNYGKALAASVSEGLYDCPASDLMTILSRDGVKQYNYIFTHAPDNPIVYYPELEHTASYGGDSAFWFGTDGMSYPRYVSNFSEFERDEFIPVVQNWLTSFVKNSNPGNGWKHHIENDSSGNHGVNSIGANSVNGAVMVPKRTYDDRCAFWAQFKP